MDNGVIGMFEPTAELSKLSLQSNEVLVIKIDTNKYDLDTANEIFHEMVKHLPEDCQKRVIGIPAGVELETANVNWLINRLEHIKNECIH